MSIEKIARQYEGRSRMCAKCPFHPCSDIQFKVCDAAFVEGFRKGAQHIKKQQKKED